MRAGDISLTCGQELTQKVLAVSFLWLLTLGLAETKLHGPLDWTREYWKGRDILDYPNDSIISE